MREFVPKSIGNWCASGVNERLRFYRYEIGQQFDWHYDGAFERPDGECGKLTFMIYLNDDFEGGQTFLPMMRLSFRSKGWRYSSCIRFSTKASLSAKAENMCFEPMLCIDIVVVSC